MIREANGLTLSSRNRYLSEPERREAEALSRSLHAAQVEVTGGQRDTVLLRFYLDSDATLV
nr:pantoate--beta-alanine ligase [Terriglobus roseus]